MSIWVKRNDGWVCGIFEGLAYKTGLNPNLFRALWFLSLILFGSGFLFYLFLMMVIPHEDEVLSYYRPKALGVCYRLAQRTNIELSLVRLLMLGSFFLSFGVTFLIYFILWFFLPERQFHSFVQAPNEK